MADNTTLNPGTGGDTIASDDIAGVKYQRTKVNYGADGAAIDVSAANPLPTDTITEPAVAADGGALPAVQKVVAGYDGTNVQVIKTDAAGELQVDVLTLPTVTVQDGGGSVSVDDNGGSLTVDGPLTDAQLRAAVVPTQDSRLPAALDADGGLKVHAQTAIPVTDNGGNLSIDDGGNSITVDGAVSVSNFPATQPVSGTVDTELPAAAALADGAANPTVPGVGGFCMLWNGTTWDRVPGTAANGLKVTGPLTDTQLRATPVPVSGTVTANAGTGPFPVSDNAGSLTVDAPVGTPAFVRLSDGSAAIATLPVSLATNTPDVTDRDARLAGRVKNLDSAGAVIDPALKGQLPAALVGGRLDVNIGAPATLPVSLATNTPDVTDRAGRLVGVVSGAANVFHVDDNAASLTVDAPAGTPVFARLSDGAAALVGQKTMANSLPVAVASDQSALTVAQATAANLKALVDQGTAASAANAWTAKVTDGTNVGAVKAASTAAVAADPAQVVALSPNQNTQALALFARPRKLATYRANFRTVTRIYNLSKAMTANSRTQFATIHHAASATKTVRIRRAGVVVRDVSVAGGFAIDFVRITAAPATGNPAITPGIADNADGAAEATCLALPTTAGTEAAVWTSQYMNLGVTGAAPVTSPPPPFPTIDLLNPSTGEFDDETKSPVIRAGVLEGWAITFDSNAASTVDAWCFIEFTEE